MSSDKEPARQKHIIVKPSSAQYAEQMEDLMHASYGTTREDPEQVFTAAMFRKHLDIFPEGQFIAVDSETDTVVGITVSMRTHFDPNQRHSESWWSSIGYG
jgi:hypothetical protein